MPQVNSCGVGGIPQPVAIVDDDPFIRSVVKAAMRAAGIDEVHEYHAAEDVIADLDSVRPRLVLMDYVLPGMSGAAAWKIIHRRLANSGHSVQLVFLTARDAALIDVGPEVCGILAKPFNPLTLVARLGDMLGGASPAAGLSAQVKLAGVAEQFRKALPDTARAIDDMWLKASSGDWDGLAAHDVLERTHKLAGTAGLFGLQAVGALAEVVEAALLQSLKNDAPPSEEEMRRLQNAVTALTEVCRTA